MLATSVAMTNWLIKSTSKRVDLFWLTGMIFSTWAAGFIPTVLHSQAGFHNSGRYDTQSRAHLMASGKQKEITRNKQRRQYNLQRHALQNSPPPIRPYLLLFPSSSNSLLESSDGSFTDCVMSIISQISTAKHCIEKQSFTLCPF